MSHDAKIKELVAKHLKLDVEKVKNDSHLINDLNADSIDIVEIGMLLETEFGIDVSSEDTNDFRTVQHLIDYINSKV
jgi:acyl carrier protein